MNTYVFCDPNLCIGCGMCERRCIMAHQQLSLTEVKLDDPMQRQRCKAYRAATVKIAQHCRHCEGAPCMKACPVGAIERITGEVGTMIYIHEDRCIGCRECVFACPFSAVYIGPTPEGRDVATKCDLCLGIEGGPQCVAYCPKKALTVMTEEAVAAMLRQKREATVTVNADDVAPVRPPRQNP